MGGDRERDRLSRRVHPVRRHVPQLQRLHARLRPARGAGRPPRRLRVDARLGGARARTGPRTSPWSTTRRCERCRTCGSSGRPTRTRRRRRGAWRSSGAADRSRWRSPARSCRRSPRPPSARPTACAGAGTSCASRRRPADRGRGRKAPSHHPRSPPDRRSTWPSARRRRCEREGIRDARRQPALWELFERQDAAYREAVLPAAVRARVTVEAGLVPRLGSLGGRRGRDHRARPVRRLGARPGGRRAVRLHGGARHRGRRDGGPRRAPRARSRSRPVPGTGPAIPDTTEGGDDARRVRRRPCAGPASSGAASGALAALAPDHELSTSAVTAATPSDDYPDFAGAWAGRLPTAGRTAASSSAAAASAPPSRPTRSAASGPCVCHDTYSARQGVEHDDMNVLCLGARVVGDRGRRRNARGRSWARASPARPATPARGESARDRAVEGGRDATEEPLARAGRPS